jgi:hypothetical protein
MKEFEQELAVLKGRVDGLEAKVGELEATQFSTTTKLRGETTFDVGAYTYGGSYNRSPAKSGPGLDGEPLLSAMVFNYDVRLNFDTSFTGKDLLRTRLRSGNYGNSVFDGAQYRSTKLDKSFESEAGPDVVNIDRLYYTFPVGNELTSTIGARLRNTEMLAITPSAYKSSISDFLYGTYGTSGTYNKETGAGVGLVWKQKVKKGNPYLAAAVNYVAKNADKGNADEGGIMTDNSAGSFLAQIGGAGEHWALTGAYRYGQCGTNIRSGTQYTYDNSKAKCSDLGGSAATNSVAIIGYWQPSESGWIPSISAGWGITGYSQYDDGFNFDGPTANSWYVGLQWDDAFIKGNALGMAVGQPTFITRAKDGSNNTPNDGNYAWEWWYKFQVTDNISVTPAIFYLSQLEGQFAKQGSNNNSLTNFGGLIKTTFKF